MSIPEPLLPHPRLQRHRSVQADPWSSNIRDLIGLSLSDTLICNFGRNIRFTPDRIYAPRNEEDVLALLAQYCDSSVRVAGSLHSWSDAAETGGVLVDMRHFDWVEIPRRRGGELVVTVGGGCRLERLIDVLRTGTGLTLPTIGTVLKQTVAGAISTGTHGSGCSSLSHYVAAVRIAAYDQWGKPAIHDICEGEALHAVRCGLGCTGIIVSVTLKCVPLYDVAESVAVHTAIEPILAAAAEHPLQEFALVPYYWKYVAYQRSQVTPGHSVEPGFITLLYRVYKLVVVDCLLHTMVKAGLLGCVLGERFHLRTLKLLFGATPLLLWPAKALTKRRGVVDRSDLALTRKHHYFTHVETEVFVRKEHVASAARVLRSITEVFAGEPGDPPEDVRDLLAGVGLLDRLNALRGRYAHHYPFYFRRVLPDDTLMSMTSGDAEYYAIGIFCYLSVRKRRRYFEYAAFVADALMRVHGGRLHWGKYLPMFPEVAVTAAHVDLVYPGLFRFQRYCEAVDPAGVFRNDFARRILDLQTRCPVPVHNRPLRRSS